MDFEKRLAALEKRVWGETSRLLHEVPSTPKVTSEEANRVVDGLLRKEYEKSKGKEEEIGTAPAVSEEEIDSTNWEELAYSLAAQLKLAQDESLRGVREFRRVSTKLNGDASEPSPPNPPPHAHSYPIDSQNQITGPCDCGKDVRPPAENFEGYTEFQKQKFRSPPDGYTEVQGIKSLPSPVQKPREWRVWRIANQINSRIPILNNFDEILDVKEVTPRDGEIESLIRCALLGSIQSNPLKQEFYKVSGKSYFKPYGEWVLEKLLGLLNDSTKGDGK